MIIRYLADVRQEIDEAAAYYEAISPRLGKRFQMAVRDSVRQISRHPSWWPKVAEQARRYLLIDWPYSVYYVVDGDHLLVVAVGHRHRQPEYWQDRLRKRSQ